MREKSKPKLFLIYSKQDSAMANIIIDRLHKKGINTLNAQYELGSSDSIKDVIHKYIKASDYILVLFSPRSVNNNWVRYEISIAYNLELESRDILILPILLEKCEVPTFLGKRVLIDLSTNFNKNLDDLVEWVIAIHNLNFSSLNARLFENLVQDLLDEIGFKNIRKDINVGNFRIDFLAELDNESKKERDYWLIEVKFYREERASLEALYQLNTYLSVSKLCHKALLITNGQLTSEARNWLVHTKLDTTRELRVIEGPELKRILLSHIKLINKYFGEDIYCGGL